MSESPELVQVEMVWVFVAAHEDTTTSRAAETGNTHVRVILGYGCQVLP